MSRLTITVDEVALLKGRGSEVQELADHIITERGVRQGHVVYPGRQSARSWSR